MRIDIITVLPELIKSPFEASILKRAIEAGLVSVHFHNLRDYTADNYKSIDDTQFGGGAGMVMMIEPIDKCISKLKKERDYDEVIYMTPDGQTLNQGLANQLSMKGNIINSADTIKELINGCAIILLRKKFPLETMYSQVENWVLRCFVILLFV